MAWISQPDGTRRYQIKIRSRKAPKIFTFPTKKVAQAYLAERKDRLKRRREFLQLMREREEKLDKLQSLIDRIVEDSLLCSGYITRQGVLSSIRLLHKSLTKPERDLIRRKRHNSRVRKLTDHGPSPFF